MRLQVAVGAGDVSDFDGEEDVAVVAGPARAGFYRLVVGDADGIGMIGIGGCQAESIDLREYHSQSERVDFDVFVFFLALVDGVGEDTRVGCRRAK